MDALDLRVFEAVARLGGMNRAASELNTVQSNVTARIRILEQELDTPLFTRHSRGVALTPAGKRLLPYAMRVARLLDDARRAARDDGTPKGALTIGSLETTAAVRLPSVLADYAATYPEVDLVLATGTTNDLIESVLQNRLEGAFVCAPVHHPDLDEEVIFDEELALATTRSVRQPAQLLQSDGLKIVVLRAGCSYRQRLETILAKRGVVGLRQLEFGTLDAIIGCVAAGVGVTLLPKSVLLPAVRERRIAMHSLGRDEAFVGTAFVRRRDTLVSSALDAFLQCARSAPARTTAAR